MNIYEHLSKFYQIASNCPNPNPNPECIDHGIECGGDNVVQHIKEYRDQGDLFLCKVYGRQCNDTYVEEEDEDEVGATGTQSL